MTEPVTNPLFVVRELLLASSALSTLTEGRIYADPELPTDYLPSQGVAIVMSLRGGGDDYSGKTLDPSIQFAIYGPGDDMGAAWNVYREMKVYLDDAKSAEVMSAWMETGGQLIPPSSRGAWRAVFAGWRFLIHNV